MTETLDPMDQQKIDPQQLAQQLLAQAKADGVELVGPNGLLNQPGSTVGDSDLILDLSSRASSDSGHGRVAGLPGVSTGVLGRACVVVVR